MRFRKVGQLAAVGSVGNNTHASVATDSDYDVVDLEFEITAVGATPTVSFKFQGSMDGPEVPDANSDWFDIAAIPEDGTAAAVTYVKTAVGVYEYTVEQETHPIRKVRLVTSANTNVTYEGEAYAGIDV